MKDRAAGEAADSAAAKAMAERRAAVIAPGPRQTIEVYALAKIGP